MKHFLIQHDAQNRKNFLAAAPTYQSIKNFKSEIASFEDFSISGFFLLLLSTASDEVFTRSKSKGFGKTKGWAKSGCLQSPREIRKRKIPKEWKTFLIFLEQANFFLLNKVIIFRLIKIVSFPQGKPAKFSFMLADKLFPHEQSRELNYTKFYFNPPTDSHNINFYLFGTNW